MPVAVIVDEIADLFLAVAGQRVGSDPGPDATALRAQPGAPDHIRLHIREDPDFSELADGGVFGHFLRSAPGRIRTCAHGSGGRCSIP